jgi:hypothetical protein
METAQLLPSSHPTRAGRSASQVRLLDTSLAGSSQWSLPQEDVAQGEVPLLGQTGTSYGGHSFFALGGMSRSRFGSSAYPPTTLSLPSLASAQLATQEQSIAVKRRRDSLLREAEEAVQQANRSAEAATAAHQVTPRGVTPRG